MTEKQQEIKIPANLDEIVAIMTKTVVRAGSIYEQVVQAMSGKIEELNKEIADLKVAVSECTYKEVKED